MEQLTVARLKSHTLPDGRAVFKEGKAPPLGTSILVFPKITMGEIADNNTGEMIPMVLIGEYVVDHWHDYPLPMTLYKVVPHGEENDAEKELILRAEERMAEASSALLSELMALMIAPPGTIELNPALMN